MLRVACTTDGINFSTAGLANGGVISGAQRRRFATTPTSATRRRRPSPSNLNAYATPGTRRRHRDAVGGIGRLHHHQPRRQLRPVPLRRLGGRRGQRRLQPDLLYASRPTVSTGPIPTSVVSTDYTFAASVAQDQHWPRATTRRWASVPTTRAGPTGRAWSRTPTAP